MWRSLILCGALLLSASTAAAWWDTGHKLTGSIAFRRLSPVQRERVVELLKHHPRWQADFAEKMPEDLRHAPAETQAEWTFQQAAVWPDLARDLRGEDQKTYHHSPWHYVNLPQFLTPADRDALHGQLRINISAHVPRHPEQEMNVVQTIGVARRIVGDRSASAADRALFASWLIHAVGDVHQPLHTTALFSRRLFPEGCRGGNLVKTVQRKNLHSLWDSLPGEGASYRTVHNRVLLLLQEADLQHVGAQAAQATDVATWVRESREFAETAVYADEVLTVLRAAEAQGGQPPVIELSEEYLKTAGAIAERRIVEAGYRLAAVLAELVR